jgi:hypothetical protein
MRSICVMFVAITGSFRLSRLLSAHRMLPGSHPSDTRVRADIGRASKVTGRFLDKRPAGYNFEETPNAIARRPNVLFNPWCADLRLRLERLRHRRRQRSRVHRRHPHLHRALPRGRSVDVHDRLSAGDLLVLRLAPRAQPMVRVAKTRLTDNARTTFDQCQMTQKML